MLCRYLKWMLIFCLQNTRLNISKLLNMAFKSFITLFMLNLLDLINSEEGRLKYPTLVVILTIFSPNISDSVSFLGGMYTVILFCLIYKGLCLLYLLGRLHLLLSNVSLSVHLPTFCWNFSLPSITIATPAFFWLTSAWIVLFIPLFSTIPCHFWCISCIKVTQLEVLPSSLVKEL